MPVDEFESAEAVADHIARQCQQIERCLRGWYHHHRSPRRGGARHKTQSGRCDNPQRPLGPDHQIAQVIAGVVFAQAAKTAPD